MGLAVGRWGKEGGGWQVGQRKPGRWQLAGEDGATVEMRTAQRCETSLRAREQTNTVREGVADAGCAHAAAETRSGEARAARRGSVLICTMS